MTFPGTNNVSSLDLKTNLLGPVHIVPKRKERVRGQGHPVELPQPLLPLLPRQRGQALSLVLEALAPVLHPAAGPRPWSTDLLGRAHGEEVVHGVGLFRTLGHGFEAEAEDLRVLAKPPGK